MNGLSANTIDIINNIISAYTRRNADAENELASINPMEAREDKNISNRANVLICRGTAIYLAIQKLEALKSADIADIYAIPNSIESIDRLLNNQRTRLKKFGVGSGNYLMQYEEISVFEDLKKRLIGILN